MRLENKVALISGGARGMGAEEAKLFAQEGAKVVIGDVLTEEGRQTEAQINETGAECLFVQLDVTSEADWKDAVAAAVARFGKLDILVNNAGISISGGLEEFTEEQWDRTMDINSKGVFLGTREAIPAMREAGGGSIINISSARALPRLRGPRQPTPPARAQYEFSARRPRSSTPGKAYAAIQSTQDPYRRPCSGQPGPMNRAARTS